MTDAPEGIGPDYTSETTRIDPPSYQTITPQSVPNDNDLPRRSPFPIVGIGASAGGIQAFEAFFTHMPPDSGMAFVLVQHLDPTHTSVLAAIIGRYTSMEVTQATDGVQVVPNCVYVIPPNRDMALLRTQLHLIEPASPRGFRFPIDFFFRSLADELREYAIGIILSGTGTDGTLGLRAIKGAGGMAIVQEPASAMYDGMPRSAIDTGLADYTLPPEQMPARLLRYMQYEFVTGLRSLASPASQSIDALQKIVILLRNQTGHDFSQYKQSTMLRRIERRMAMHQLSWSADYIRYLQQNSREVTALLRDLFIGVTSFFRDREAFVALEQHVIPHLFAHASPQDPLRIWVPGCATGEEAFSLAVLLHHQMEVSQQDYPVQIFATDIDAQAIEKARTGIYPESIAADVPQKYLHYFLRQNNNTFQVSRNIREMIIFAVQSVIKDPPFSHLDLISCRNLLIYFEPELQEKVLTLFHRALKPHGFLFLGSAETPDRLPYLFTPIDRKWQICQRLSGAALTTPVLDFVLPSLPTMPFNSPAVAPPAPTGLRNLLEQQLLESYAPPCVVIDEHGEIRYFYGKTGKYWETGTGSPEWNIFRLARAELQLALTLAIRKATTQPQEVVQEEAHYGSNGSTQRVVITVHPIPNTRLFIVTFEEAGSSQAQPLPTIVLDPTDERDAFILKLQQELKTAQDYLSFTSEEVLASNEELRASNEELRASNEELRASNEELGTSKEELQSVNEELLTVNAELQNRISELNQANNYLKNLLANIEVGIIFLDMHLHVVWFTPTVTRVIPLIPTDIGRPLHHLVTHIDYEGVLQDAYQVLDTLQERASEVCTRDSSEWYWMRITPYRTVDHSVEGVTITFSAITQQKQVQTELRKLTQAIEQSSNMIVIADSEGNIEYVNPQFSKRSGYPAREVIGQHVCTLAAQQQVRESFEQAWQQVQSGQEWHGEYRKRSKDGAWHWAAASCAPVRDDSGTITHFIIEERDSTERKEREEALQTSDTFLKSIYSGIHIPILVIDVTEDGRFWYAGTNPAFERMTGYPHIQVQGRYLDELTELLGTERIAWLQSSFQGIVETGEAIEYEQMIPTPAHQPGAWWSVHLEPLKDQQGRVYRIVSTSHLITDLKRSEAALHRRDALLASLGRWWQQIASDAMDDHTLLEALARLLGESGGYAAAWVASASPDELTILHSAAYVGEEDPSVQREQRAWLETEAGPALAYTARQSQQPVIIEHIQTDPGGGSWRASALRYGYTSAVALAFQHAAPIVSMIVVFAAGLAGTDAHDLSLLHTLAENLANGLSVLDMRK